MRKLLVLLTVCVMATSAVAGDITFTVTAGATPGEFVIGYSATDPAAVPVGMGIKVSLTDATIASGAAATAVDSFFDVYLDYASEDPCTYVIGAGNPIADPCAAGTPDYTGGISEFSICLGALDPCNAAAQNVANLITIDVDCSTAYDVAISADALRGGIVGADFDNVYFVGATDLGCAVIPPVPACWLSATQCHGDATGDAAVNNFDWPFFRDGYFKTYPDAAYVTNLCGDFNQDGSINNFDWPAFRDNYFKAVAADCVQPQGTWPPL